MWTTGKSSSKLHTIKELVNREHKGSFSSLKAASLLQINGIIWPEDHLDLSSTRSMPIITQVVVCLFHLNLNTSDLWLIKGKRKKEQHSFTHKKIYPYTTDLIDATAGILIYLIALSSGQLEKLAGKQPAGSVVSSRLYHVLLHVVILLSPWQGKASRTVAEWGVTNTDDYNSPSLFQFEFHDSSTVFCFFKPKFHLLESHIYKTRLTYSILQLPNYHMK